MIELRDVRVSLGGNPVVDGVSVTIAEGEWLALIGPNGAGKTTLLRAMASLVPFDGEIELDGRSVSELGRSELARYVAVVPQEPSTPPWMTVAEYVLLGRTPHLGPLAKEGRRDREAAARALARLDLLTFGNRRLGTLSGGEKQRVVVARALAQEAPVVLLDEPTAALDIGHQQQAFDLLDGLRVESGLDAGRRHARPHPRRAVRGPHGAPRPGAGRRGRAGGRGAHRGASLGALRRLGRGRIRRRPAGRRATADARRPATAVLEVVRRRVPRLVEEDLVRAGYLEVRRQPEAKVLDRPGEDSTLLVELRRSWPRCRRT